MSGHALRMWMPNVSQYRRKLGARTALCHGSAHEPVPRPSRRSPLSRPAVDVRTHLSVGLTHRPAAPRNGRLPRARTAPGHILHGNARPGPTVTITRPCLPKDVCDNHIGTSSSGDRRERPRWLKVRTSGDLRKPWWKTKMLPRTWTP